MTPRFLSKELPFAFPLEMLPEEVVRGGKGERRSALGCVWLDLSPYPWWEGTHAEQRAQRQKTVPLYWFCVPETPLTLSGPVFSSVKWKLYHPHTLRLWCCVDVDGHVCYSGGKSLALMPDQAWEGLSLLGCMLVRNSPCEPQFLCL